MPAKNARSERTTAARSPRSAPAHQSSTGGRQTKAKAYKGALRPRRPRESAVNQQERMTRIAQTLASLYPDAHCELDHRSPFELIVATILSAQTTDVLVNKATPALFARFPEAAALAAAAPAEVESLVHALGFYRNKTKNIIGCAQALVDRHAGEVPRTMAELTALPGVARKTANVVLGSAFGINEGVVVDTHVDRISKLLGLVPVDAKPPAIERALMALVPRARWTDFSHWIIWHGRRCCTAKAPNCAGCGIVADCPSAKTPD